MCAGNAHRRKELTFRRGPGKDVDDLKMAYMNLRDIKAAVRRKEKKK